MKKQIAVCFLAMMLGACGMGEAAPLSIERQGIFSAGGMTITSPGTFDPYDQWEASGKGQTAHVDHANVLYQIPEKADKAPLVFLHGYGQSRMGWMTTPDGRPGWSELFLRNGHGVFLVDEPRRGEAGATSTAGEISVKTLEQRWYTQFRIGKWENGRSVPHEGSQFVNSEEAVDQFFRQMTPDTGMKSDMGADFDGETVAKALAATIDKVYEMTGEKSVLITHSQGGRAGWLAAKYTKNIAAIVAIEPGNAPAEESEEYRALLAQHIPIAFYFGDYIHNGDEKLSATKIWQSKLAECETFSEAYRAAGGQSVVVDLPKEGIFGNDHFMFQNANHDVIAGHIETWLASIR